MQTQHTPWVPVEDPAGDWQSETVAPLYGYYLGAEESEAELERRALEERRKRFFTYGMIGVGIGALVTGAMTAVAFNSYKRSDSAVTPAAYTAIGSLALGGTMVWLLSRTVGGETMDPRMAAMAVGARLGV